MAPPLCAALACALSASCAGPQNMLDAAGEHARHLSELWWLMLAVLAAIYILVCGAILMAAYRSSHTGPQTRLAETAPERERRMSIVVGAAVGATAVVLFVFLFASFSTGHALNSLARTPADLTIKVTGQQWWWDVEYQDPVPSNTVITANEIHIPLGKTVQLILVSTDVIHSFWVPNLAGKKDLIPGHQNTMWLKAERPGLYHGQCAEFCGHQHANMRFHVVVETEEQFQAWLQAQRKPAVEPSDERLRHGQHVFLTGPCAMCHSVRGTDAAGFVAPDLTHVASRARIGAGALPNTREHLLRWVADSQSIKPGNHMPPLTLPPQDLDAVVAYLESLK
ncbi:MAG TPA: cytochrome c oxidase subunit II [Candidatus Limnocylindrales bacterium]|nr:cytochrome c oxidase subunit II [Candidatus Limnocylindrales bacterium]